jgi:hypothetical protein
MTLEFDFEVSPQLVLASINSSILSLYIEPALERHQEFGFNLSTLNFTWVAYSLESNKIGLKLNFTSASSVSPLME